MDQDDGFESLEVEDNILSSTVLRKLYTSHLLSTWNARLFEFGAVLFLAVITPGTLLYASIYAFVRSLAAIILATTLGSYIDRANRLVVVRASIFSQRIAVLGSCLVFGLLVQVKQMPNAFFALSFIVLIILACFEKLGFVANTIAIERDWIPVIADGLGCERSILNATMRRIDLICKLVAPVTVALVQTYSTTLAILGVFVLSALSLLVEYLAIAKVYVAVPELWKKAASSAEVADSVSNTPFLSPHHPTLNRDSAATYAFIETWSDYFHTPVFLGSLSLSLLYLTVLSTGVQYQTYMLSIGFSPVVVSLIRIAAVCFELSATCFGPVLFGSIGQLRGGLWSINWQLASLTSGVAIFTFLGPLSVFSSWSLTIAIVISRVGLWGLDLAVQDLIQDRVPEQKRGKFSACETGLQNLFELLSFASTIAFPAASQFQYPIYLSLCAVIISAGCYAAYVRRERGHLIHLSSCLKTTTNVI